MNFIALAVLLVHLPATFADLVVDISTAVSRGSLTCLQGTGVSYAIIRAWQSNGQPDENAAQTFMNIPASGIMYAAMYMSPCYSCGDAASVFQS